MKQHHGNGRRSSTSKGFPLPASCASNHVSPYLLRSRTKFFFSIFLVSFHQISCLFRGHSKQSRHENCEQVKEAFSQYLAAEATRFVLHGMEDFYPSARNWWHLSWVSSVGLCGDTGRVPTGFGKNLNVHVCIQTWGRSKNHCSNLQYVFGSLRLFTAEVREGLWKSLGSGGVLYSCDVDCGSMPVAVWNVAKVLEGALCGFGKCSPFPKYERKTWCSGSDPCG